MDQIKKTKFARVFCFLLTTYVTLALVACGPKGLGILGKQSSEEALYDPKIVNAPFAYDIAIDTISYNSCASNTITSTMPIFGIKMGASEGFVDGDGSGDVRGGIKLRSDFLQHVGRSFQPEYPSNTVTPAQVQKILGKPESVLNNKAYPQFGVRRKSDFASIVDLMNPAPGAATTSGVEVISFPRDLSSGFLGYSITKSLIFNPAGIVIQEGPRAYNLSDQADPVNLEGSFRFNAVSDATRPNGDFEGNATEKLTENYSQVVRDRFNANTQLLTATFGGTGAFVADPDDDIDNIKRPFGGSSSTSSFDQSKAYGRGYYLKFESQTSETSWPKNRLTRVTEMNLETGTPATTSWSCEQYPIAGPGHWDNNTENPDWWLATTQTPPNCAPLVAADTNCLIGDTTADCNIKKDRADKIKRIRRHYTPGEWNIGLMFKSALKSDYDPESANPLKQKYKRIAQELCLAPVSVSPLSCYLPTRGILASQVSTPADANIDVGIQYDRASPCYLTTSSPPDRDVARKLGRCAQFASICIRSN